MREVFSLGGWKEEMEMKQPPIKYWWKRKERDVCDSLVREKSVLLTFLFAFPGVCLCCGALL